MGFAKPIEQYLFGNLLIRIHGFMYLKDIIRGDKAKKERNSWCIHIIGLVNCCLYKDKSLLERYDTDWIRGYVYFVL